MPLAEKLEMARWVCRHCGHEWIVRKPLDPVMCPGCKRRRP